jgi:hypothetical protein
LYRGEQIKSETVKSNTVISRPPQEALLHLLWYPSDSSIDAAIEFHILFDDQAPHFFFMGSCLLALFLFLPLLSLHGETSNLVQVHTHLTGRCSPLEYSKALWTTSRMGFVPWRDLVLRGGSSGRAGSAPKA